MGQQQSPPTASGAGEPGFNLSPDRPRGKIKIFLGYAPGVGKARAMLEAARQRNREGQDVVIAHLEPHHTSPIGGWQQGLEVISGRSINADRVTLTTVDLDAVLARRPHLALVDELAHPNAPGSRHAKRYQDVLELLKAGIDVYTTLNIQHLESLTDVVAQITGVTMRETVPDRLLDEADAVELIDLPVDELLQRFKRGEVKITAFDAVSSRHFFRPGNLTALRELTLRRVADRIDEQLRDYMHAHAIAGPWPAGERLLVCVSPSPLSERLVRAARRLAVRLNAEWFAVFVETPGSARLTAADRDRVAHNLQLAESLGAKPFTITGNAVAEAIGHFAQSRNVTKIVAGKPLRPRWQELLRGSVVDQIIRHSGDLDIYVISSSAETAAASLTARPYLARSGVNWRHFGQSAALVALTTLLIFPLRPYIDPINLVMFYLLAVVIAAMWLGRRPAMLASLLSVIAFNFVFVPPYYTYRVADAQFLLTFAALLSVGIIISTLTARAREQAQAARRRETDTATLYELSRALADAATPEAIDAIVARHISQIFNRRAALLLPNANQDNLHPCARTAAVGRDQTEEKAALWAFQHSQPAGHGTDTLAEACNTYLPLKTGPIVAGVLALDPAETTDRLPPEQWRLLDAFANQTAQAVRRVQLAAEARQAQLLRETEKLQTALLNSISHDLRTPLASITGALSSLRDDAAFLDANARSVLVTTAWEQAERLNSLVGNLLEMTRLESGAMKVKKELCDVQDVIGVAVTQLGHRLADRDLEIEAPADLPLAPLDFVLMVQVLVNLLDNALKYSPADRPIAICARATPDELEIAVADQGRGIPPQALTRVFDKFYRAGPSAGVSGTGLGLSISKGIVEAHGGRIWAQNRADGGAVITLALPIEPTIREVNL